MTEWPGSILVAYGTRALEGARGAGRPQAPVRRVGIARVPRVVVRLWASRDPIVATNHIQFSTYLDERGSHNSLLGLF